VSFFLVKVMRSAGGNLPEVLKKGYPFCLFLMNMAPRRFSRQGSHLGTNGQRYPEQERETIVSANDPLSSMAPNPMHVSP
jgi:hypothetical protein